jgi:hypothetical protein
VRAASDEPALFERLVLVAPRSRAGTEAAPTWGQTVVRLAQRSFLGLVPYAVLTTRTALRWQLQRRAARAGEGAATDDAVDHIYASAHQFGAEFAPLAQLTGELDLAVPNALALLEPPVLIVAGERDSLQPLADLEHLVLVNPHAQFISIPSAGDAIYEDAPEAFVDRLNLWLGTERPRSTTRLADVMHPGPMAASGVRERTIPDSAAAAPASGASFHGSIVSAEQDGAQTPRGDGPTAVAPPSAAAPPDEGEVDFLPLDETANADREPRPGEPRFDSTPPAPEMMGIRGDVRAGAAPPDLARALEASIPAPAEAPAPTQPAAAEAGGTLRVEMSAPEVPAPTTLAAMTAPLGEQAPRPEEGVIEPESGAHPVPAEAHGEISPEQPATVRADAAVAHNETARTGREEQAIQTRETARMQTEAEDRVSEEAARLEERTQATGLASPPSSTAASEKRTDEAAPSTRAAETHEPSAASTPVEKPGQPTGDAKTGPSSKAPATSPRADVKPAGADSGEMRQAPGRSSIRPAPEKGAQPGSGTASRAPGQSGGQSGGSKRQSSRKPKHSHH